MKKFFSSLIFALMLSVLTGVVVYRWQMDVYMQKDAMHAQEIEVLQQKINMLMAQNNQPLEDLEECEGFSAEPATTNVAYSNPEWGIEFSIPYNEQWGYPEQPADPYVELDKIDGLLFGVPREVAPCQWAYTYQLTVLPSRTQEEMEADILARNAARIESGDVLKEQLITPIESSIASVAFTYDVPGFCLAKSIEIFGENHNYIVTACYTDIEQLQTVASGLKPL